MVCWRFGPRFYPNQCGLIVYVHSEFNSRHANQYQQICRCYIYRLMFLWHWQTHILPILAHMLWQSGELHILAPLALLFLFLPTSVLIPRGSFASDMPCWQDMPAEVMSFGHQWLQVSFWILYAIWFHMYGTIVGYVSIQFGAILD